jgi:hypothetical protein
MRSDGTGGLPGGRAAARREGHQMQIPNGTPGNEVPGTWRKSTASNPSGACVEVAALADGEVAVRNSRHPAGPALIYTRAEVTAFLAGVRNGEFDDLG